MKSELCDQKVASKERNLPYFDSIKVRVDPRRE